MERSARNAATRSRAVPGLLSEAADAGGSRATVACSMRGERLGGVGGVGSVGGIGGCGGVGELVLQGHKGRAALASSCCRIGYLRM